MAPSLSTLERSNPPPRRKSCAACIKAKRRCDLRQPSCLRCSQRKIDCSYPVQHASLAKKRSDTAPSPAGTTSDAHTPAPEFMKDVLPELSSWEADFDFNMDLSPAYTPPCPSFPTISFDEPPLPGLEFLNDVVNLDATFSPMPPTPSTALVFEDPLPLVVRSPKSQIASPSRMQVLRIASELIECRLRYSMDVFKRAPEEMLLEGGTFWSHPALYRESMPTCLEDALAACALHRAKNTVNAAMIQRVIELRYQKLLTSPIPTTSATELMARTHALILYQIMLFFDDSCAARALAEETMSALLDSATALLEFAQHETEDEDDAVASTSRHIPLYPLAPARALYRDWTLQESLRRTLLVSFLFTQVQCLMRADFSGLKTTAAAACPPGPSCAPLDAAVRYALQHAPMSKDGARCDPRLFCLGLTLSAHLWHARDAVSFAVAWRDKPHLVAQPWSIWKRIDAAQPDDIDQLGRILMTTGMGIEEAKGWFASKGGKL